MTLALLYELGIPAILGGAIGGATNHLAIHMLFHPYDEVRVLGLRLPFTPGLVPKRKLDIAERIAQAVSEHLVNEEALTEALHSPDIEQAVRETVGEQMDAWLAEPLRETAGRILTTQWEELITSACDVLEDLCVSFAATDEFTSMLETELQHGWNKIKDRRIEHLLEEEGLQAAESFVSRVLTKTLSAPKTKKYVLGVLEENIEELFTRQTPLRELMGSRAMELLETQILTGLVKCLPKQADSLLESDSVKEWLTKRTEDLLSKVIVKGRVFDSVAIKYVDPEDTVENILSLLEKELESLPLYLAQEDVQKELQEGIGAAMDDLVSKPLGDLMQKVGSGDYLRAKKWIKEAVTSALLSKETASRLADYIIPQLRAKASLRLDDLTGTLNEEERENFKRAVVRQLNEALTEKGAMALAMEQVKPLLSDRLGALVPGENIPSASVTRMREVLTGNVLGLMRQNASRIVCNIDIHAMVRKRVEDFPTPKLEAIVKECASHELRAITLLGFVLGAIIGLSQPLIHLLTGNG